MQKRVDDYFEACKGRVFRDDDGKILLDKFGRPTIIDEHPPTITGLALALGFLSRESLLNYQKRDGFKEIITVAKSRVEQYVEERLFDKDGAAGAKFSLAANFKGWSAAALEEESKAARMTVNIINDIPKPAPAQTPKDSQDPKENATPGDAKDGSE